MSMPSLITDASAAATRRELHELVLRFITTTISERTDGCGCR